MSNKSVGNQFEQDVAIMLSKNGFWAHLVAQRAEGQPADIIAAKNGVAYLIDCKDCEKDIFRLSRIEENQENAMKKWLSCGNLGAYFCIRFAQSNEIYMVQFDKLIEQRDKGIKSLKRRDMIFYPSFRLWTEARK